MNIEIWAALTIGLMVYLAVEFLTARDMARVEQHLKDIKVNLKDIKVNLKDIKVNLKDIRGMLKNSNVTVKYHVQRNKKTDRSE